MTTDPDEALIWISALFKEYEVEVSAWIREKEVKILLLGAQPTSDKLDRYPRGTKQRRIEEWRIEERRIAAVRELLAFCRSPPVEDRARIFFEQEWWRILRAPDPTTAAAEFFNGKPRRGRKPDSEERNLRIARAVQALIDTGMTVGQACKEAGLRHAPWIGSWERIREIYYGPAVDEEAKKDWQFTIGARQPTATDLLPAIEPCLRAVLAVTDQDPELWLDFLINGRDLI
jgi:hypothetical protein